MNIEPINAITLLIQVIFSLVLLSYFFLILYPEKREKKKKRFSSITVIVPVHNEEKYIAGCINSIKEAEFNGKKKIIVVNDGSTDKSSEIINSMKKDIDIIINMPHKGKANAINKALEKTDTELFAVVDGDSVIKKDALQKVSDELGKKNVAAATTVVKVKNTNKIVCLWLHLEQLYNSLIREIQTKINANITTPGPLSVYRTETVKKLGGFSKKGYAEDVDIAVRIIRDKKKIGFVSNTYVYTNMPYTPKEFSRQRLRFCQGVINIISRHLRLNTMAIDIYTFPILLFSYFQAVIMGSIMSYKIIHDYIVYFIDKGIIFNIHSLVFLVEWFSAIGFFHWVIKIIRGSEPLTVIAFLSIISTLMTFPLFFIAIIKYDKKITLKHIFALVFMNAFWFVVMMFQIVSFPEFFNKKRKNIWKKNE